MNENKQMVTPNIEAKITWINPDPTSSKKANASVKIGGAFVIYGISIVQGEKGLFLGMPTRFTKKNGEKSYSDIAHPITKEARDAMYKAVLGAYSQTQKPRSLFRTRIRRHLNWIRKAGRVKAKMRTQSQYWVWRCDSGHFDMKSYGHCSEKRLYCK